MFIYIFPFVGQLTDRYHEDGGLVVAANGGLDRVKELIQAENEKSGSRASIHPTEDEFKDACVYKVEGEAPEAVFIFPDAGCC